MQFLFWYWFSVFTFLFIGIFKCIFNFAFVWHEYFVALISQQQLSISIATTRTLKYYLKYEVSAWYSNWSLSFLSNVLQSSSPYLKMQVKTFFEQSRAEEYYPIVLYDILPSSWTGFAFMLFMSTPQNIFEKKVIRFHVKPDYFCGRKPYIRWLVFLYLLLNIEVFLPSILSSIRCYCMWHVVVKARVVHRWTSF